ncbi:MAG: cold shock domain-containing protein [Bacillales bacterium]|jgi:CspA family cold shock protein|nr:cold shock domain-containing protein [Bacillales bacterium]
MKKTGKVKWFNSTKGFGFIDYGGEDIYVHYSQIIDDGYRTLDTDEEVYFEMIDTEFGKQANQVERSNRINKRF